MLFGGNMLLYNSSIDDPYLLMLKTKELQEFLCQAEQELEKTAGQFVTVVKTDKGGVYSYGVSNPIDPKRDDEEADATIAKMQAANDTRALFVTVLQSSTSYEVPSAHFRNRLLEINPDNLQTQWVGLSLFCDLLFDNLIKKNQKPES